MNVVAVPQHPKQTDRGVVNQAPSSTASKTINKTSERKDQAFGSVFSKITTHEKVVDSTAGIKPSESMKSLGETISVLNSDSLEELINLLQLDSSGLEESGSLTIEKMAEFLHLDTEELKATIEELLGQDLNSNDLWDILGQIDQQVPEFLKAVMDSLAGVGQVNPQQASAVIKFLKGIELAAPKTDLYLKQELAVFTLKDMLSKMPTQLEKIMASTKSNTPLNLYKGWQTNTPFNLDKGGQTVILSEQVVVKENLTQSVAKTSETTTQTLGTTINQVKTETVTITLPVQKASQSEALIKEFQALLNRSQFGKVGGMTKMLIKMYPENLGTIRVELIQKDGLMTARLLANTSLGKEMLDSQLHQLKSAFANANVQVDRLDVTQALQDSNKNDKQQFNQSFKQQQQNNNNESNEHEETPEQASFRDFLMELEA